MIRMDLAATGLSLSERRAASIALLDARRWTGFPSGAGLLGRFFNALTGNVPLHPLADPKLEAVRAFVYDIRRHRGRRIAPRIADLKARGFDHRQIHALTTFSA